MLKKKISVVKIHGATIKIMITNLQQLYNTGNFLIRGRYISFSKMNLLHAVG